MSTPFGQVQKLLEQMSGVTTAQFQQLLDSSYFSLLKKAVRSGVALPPKEEFIRFLKYSDLYPELTEIKGIVIPDNISIPGFRITVTGPRRLFLARFKEDTSSEQVKDIADAMGYDVAFAEDLRCFADHPERSHLQQQRIIIALGSTMVYQERRHVPALSHWKDQKELIYELYSEPWSSNYLFLFAGREPQVGKILPS